MLKYLSTFLIVIGILFLSWGGYNYFHMKESQKDTLKAAYKILEDHNSVKVNLNKDDKKKTNFKPKINEVVGILEIPKIKANLPIVEGTNEDDLEKGVGHFKDSAYPLQRDQIVLSGHRDTVFRKMGELEVGDIFTIKLPYGSFSYKIVSTRIVDADDRTVIKSTAPKEVLTVTTCYPFSYIGNAPNRYILTALPIKTTTNKE